MKISISTIEAYRAIIKTLREKGENSIIPIISCQSFCAKWAKIHLSKEKFTDSAAVTLFPANWENWEDCKCSSDERLDIFATDSPFCDYFDETSGDCLMQPEREKNKVTLEGTDIWGDVCKVTFLI